MIYFNKDKFKKVIKDSGYRATFIANKLDLHRVTQYYYSSGTRTPKKETLKEIAKICRCKLGDFYDSQEEAEAREHQRDN